MLIGKLYDKKKLRRVPVMNENDGQRLTNLIFDTAISSSRFLDDDESVLDVLGKWQAERDQIEVESTRSRSKRERAKQKELAISNYSLQFRFRTFTANSEWSTVAQRLWALECSWKLVSGYDFLHDLASRFFS